MKFACYTLGCKVNQYETQAMEQLLVQSGHTLGSFDEICDGYIINTCTVTAVSDKKSRNAIRRVRKLNPAAVVGVCGCYAQSSPDEIRKLDVDVLIADGAENTACLALVEAASPSVALLTGKSPANPVRVRLQKAGAQVVTASESGVMTVFSDGQSVRVHP